MSRLNIDKQNKLQPKRVQHALYKLIEHNVEIIEVTDTEIRLMHNYLEVKFFPYSGWHTGKSITDGRGLDNLLKQLK